MAVNINCAMGVQIARSAVKCPRLNTPFFCPRTAETILKLVLLTLILQFLLRGMGDDVHVVVLQ